MAKKQFTLSLLFLLILLASPKGQAQIIFDFETPETSTPIVANEAAIVDNPDMEGNPSQKCAFYVKPAGNWSFMAFPFADGLNIANNDRVSFKVRTSTSGRIYIKFYDGENTTLESWVVEYEYMPEPDTWVELSYDISTLQNQNITLMEVAVSVDNEDPADAYFDDLRFYNSLSTGGEPVIVLNEFSRCVELGSTLNINAAASTDIGGSITTFRWDMGDGTVIENMDIISHQYSETGFYTVQLMLTDNDGNTISESFRIWVFGAGDQLSPFFTTNETYLTNEKVELSFLTKKFYANPFDADSVSIDATITQPDGTVRTVPCFFYEDVTNENGSWMTSSGDEYWMVRWSSEQTGVHQIQLEITDADGQNSGVTQEVTLLPGTTKGIIRPSATNRQFYQHSTDEMYFPFGINVAWNNISSYSNIMQNLSDGEANWMRYWHAAFTNQALEWEDGIGHYSAVAAAKQDSIIALCKQNDIYLQMVIFHHGMFSETINSNWDDSPYNTVNGGILVNPEEFFYNEEAKSHTKKLLRYVVARWGYSPELFAWELFNEVQWTGNHPNQSDRWKEEVTLWHDEMGLYLKEIDAFDHLVTTSADDDQLNELAGKDGIDIIQYHTYPEELLVNDLLSKDAMFLEDNPETSVICGEYGYAGDADVPYDQQRVAIWSSIFSQVPHLTWRWGMYTDTFWTDLFKAPATFLREEEIMQQDEWLSVNLAAASDIAGLRSKAFTQSNRNAYALVYDENFRDDIPDATIDLANLPFGRYNLEMTDITTGEQFVEDGLEVTFFSTAYQLPMFSDALVLKATFSEELQILLAFAGYDSVIGLGYDLDLDGSESLQPDDATVDFEWTVAQEPASSQFVFPIANSATVNVTPEVAGEYRFVLTITDSISQEISTDTVSVLVSAPPVADAGEDISIIIGARPMINGRNSFDPEGDLLTYNWSLVSRPEGSIAEVEFPTFSLPVLDPDVVGTYALVLVVSDNFNDSQPDTLLIDVDNIVSVAAVGESSAIRLFPNPTSEVVNVKFTGATDRTEIDLAIFDLTGRLLAKKRTTLDGQQNISFPLNGLGLTNGMYLLKVVSGNRVKALPFMVQM